MVALASNLNGVHADPFHWLISPVAEAIQMSSRFGAAGALAEMVTAFPPRVRMVMPWFSIAGVMDPFAMTPPSPPAPGAVEVVAPDPGSCAVWMVPGENPVSQGVSGVVLKLMSHWRGPSVSEYPQISCFAVAVPA